MRMKARSPKRGTNSAFWRSMKHIGQKVEKKAAQEAAIQDNFARLAKQNGVVRRRRTV